MKIVVAGLRGFPNIQGGIETHCEQLYQRIAKMGCDITVLSRRSYIDIAISEYKGITLHSLPSPTNKFLETIVHTLLCVLKARTLSPDLLHIHAIGPSLFAPLARLIGMKVVVTTHGPDYERVKWKGFAKVFLKMCEVMGMLGAHEVISIADNIAEDIRRKYGRVSTVIPNGVEIPNQVSTTGTLQQFGLVKGSYVLAVGRFVPEKGFHDLIEAFEQAGLNGWKLAIVGRADHEDSYSTGLIRQAGQHPDIVCTGFQKGLALQELYSNAGFFVIPSYYEGLPIVLLEALSYGLPCVVSDIPAHKNVHLDNSNFFQTGNTRDLADKLRLFASMPMKEDAREMQIEMIKQKFNWDQIAAETYKVYRKTLTTRK